MKILEIIPQLSSGGGERFTVDLCNKLSETEDVTLVVFHSLEKYGFYYRDLSSKVRVISLNKRIGFDFRAVIQLNSLIKTLSPDVVHTHLRAISYCVLSILLNRSILYFHTVHNAANREAAGRLSGWLRKLLFRYRFVTPITISPESKKSFIELYKIDAPMIFNGRNIPPEEFLSTEVREEVKTYCQNADTRILVCIARFYPQKRLPLLARITKRLETEGYNFTLLIIGNSKNEEIRREVESYSCQNLHILGERHNPIDYLRVADAFCLCSSHEGMPISFIEAIGVGAIPICTPVGGLVNVIKNNENGFLSNNLSEEAYYDVLKNFLELPTSQIVALKKQTMKAYEPFSMDLCASKYLSLFQSSKVTIR